MDVSNVMSVNALLSTAEAAPPTSQAPSDRPTNASGLFNQPPAELCDGNAAPIRKQFDEYTSRSPLAFDPTNWKPMIPSFSFNNGFDPMIRTPSAGNQLQLPSYSLMNSHNNASAMQPNSGHGNQSVQMQVYLNGDDPQYSIPNNTHTTRAREAPQMIQHHGERDNRTSEAPSLSESHASEPKPIKGRSFGAKSCKAVKMMRASAEAGDIQAAIRLGWGVERITKLYNEEKAARGENVVEGQSIDDPKIIAQITERQRRNRDHQRERAEKLKALAQSGDLEAAKKAGYSKKRIEELFPELKEDPLVGIKKEDLDFEDDNLLQKEHIGQQSSDMQPHDMGLSHQLNIGADGVREAFLPIQIPGLLGNSTTNGNDKAVFGTARYPMPGPGYGIQIQLRAHYEEAKRASTIAQGRVIEATQAAELAKQRVISLRNQLQHAINPNHDPSRKRKKNESIGSKKLRFKNRPTNFPSPPTTGGQTGAGKGSTADEAIEVDD